jgi:hypothetical protein
MIRKLTLSGLLKKEQNSELDEEEENFEEAVRAVNTVITHTRYRSKHSLRKRCAQSTPSSRTPGSTVADPGCLSLIPDSDFYPSRIPDLGSRIPNPKTATKERDEKISCLPFFVATNFTKLKLLNF